MGPEIQGKKINNRAGAVMRSGRRKRQQREGKERQKRALTPELRTLAGMNHVVQGKTQRDTYCRGQAERDLQQRERKKKLTKVGKEIIDRERT